MYVNYVRTPCPDRCSPGGITVRLKGSLKTPESGVNNAGDKKWKSSVFGLRDEKTLFGGLD